MKEGGEKKEKGGWRREEGGGWMEKGGKRRVDGGGIKSKEKGRKRRVDGSWKEERWMEVGKRKGGW